MVPFKKNKEKKEEWIQKDLESKLPKLDRKKIFVPNQKELFFSNSSKNAGGVYAFTVEVTELVELVVVPG